MGLKTKNVLSTSTSKEPIGFKMVMSIYKGKEFWSERKKTTFLIVFATYLLIDLLKFQV